MTANRRWSAGAQWREAREQAASARASVLGRLRRGSGPPPAAEPEPVTAELWTQGVAGMWESLAARIVDYFGENPGLVRSVDLSPGRGLMQQAPPGPLITYEDVVGGREARSGITPRDLQAMAVGRLEGCTCSLCSGVRRGGREVWENADAYRAQAQPATPWTEYYGPRITWPDEGYPCQICWAVGREPWEPARATPADVDPEVWACEAHCAGCVPPRRCDRHQAAVEARVEKAKPKRGPVAVTALTDAAGGERMYISLHTGEPDRGRRPITWTSGPAETVQYTSLWTEPGGGELLSMTRGRADWPTDLGQRIWRSSGGRCCDDSSVLVTTRIDVAQQIRTVQCGNCLTERVFTDEYLRMVVVG